MHNKEIIALIIISVSGLGLTQIGILDVFASDVTVTVFEDQTDQGAGGE